MEIVLDIDESVPAFVRAWVGHDVRQLVDGIKKMVRSGRIVPGDALPSARQLANDLGVGEETVAKAYRLLEGDRVMARSGLWGFVIHPEASARSGTEGP